jgi:two-component system chemotaxis response regulator CheV
MKTLQQELDERSTLAGNNKLELLLFRIGGHGDGASSELYGINVFKIREIVPMPAITRIAGRDPDMAGVVNIRGQIIPVVDLPAVIGTRPAHGCKILLITEFARTTQAFMLESVEEIVRLDWTDVLPPGGAGSGGDIVAIARIDGDIPGTRLAQVLDVETILRRIQGGSEVPAQMAQFALHEGAVILAADDSVVARAMLETTLQSMGLPYVMTRSGREAWEYLQSLHAEERAGGAPVTDRVALVLSDLEMPEMDGFTLTRLIKEDACFRGIPVLIHSSLSGATNEAHVKRVGADGYVAKFHVPELSAAIHGALRQPA